MSTYQRVIVRETDDKGTVFYVATHPELPGCISHGFTPEEAAESLNEARELYLEALAKAGIEPPEPQVWTGGVIPFPLTP